MTTHRQRSTPIPRDLYPNTRYWRKLKM